MSERLGLVLEGGAMRGVYTAGVLDALLDWDVRADGVLGVSAGAIHGASYVARQRGRNIRYMKRYCRDWRFMSLRSLLLTGDLVGRRFSYEDLPLRLDPFDFDAFLNSPARFYACATNLATGEAEYLPGQTPDACMDVLRASSSMPVVSTAVVLDGKKYLDGGVADSIPVRAFERMGYAHNLVVLTQPEGYVKRPDKLLPLIRLRYARYPRFVQCSASRHSNYNASLAWLRRAESDGRALVIRPSKRIAVRHMEKNPAVLQAQYDLGRQDALRLKERILSFVSGRG